MSTWSSRLFILALILAFLGFSSLFAGCRALLNTGKLWDGSSLIALAEVLITTAGFLFAGVELWRTHQTLRKPNLILESETQNGELSKSRVEQELYGLHIFSTGIDKTSARFRAIIDLYMSVQGDSPVRSFVLVLTPAEWSFSDYMDENLLAYTLEYQITPMHTKEGVNLDWKAIEQKPGLYSLRLEANDYSILPGDRVLVDSIIVAAEVSIRPGIDPKNQLWKYPDEFEVRGFTDNTAPARIYIKPDIDVSVLWKGTSD